MASQLIAAAAREQWGSHWVQLWCSIYSRTCPPLSPSLSLRPVSLVFGYALPRSSALNSPSNPSQVAASSNYGHSNCNQILGLPINHLWLLDIIAGSVQRVHVLLRTSLPLLVLLQPAPCYVPCVKLVFAANYATERASLWQIVSARYSYEHGTILSRSLSAQHVLDLDSLCHLPLLLLPHLHTHLLHAVSIYGQSEILIKCQRQLCATSPSLCSMCFCACLTAFGSVGFWFWFWVFFLVCNLIRLASCANLVYLRLWCQCATANALLICLHKCLPVCVGVCVRVCVPVCKQIWALTCALLVLSDTDTATCCSRIQSALWFLSCYKFHRLTWQLSIVAWQVTMTPAGIRYS